MMKRETSDKLICTVLAILIAIYGICCYNLHLNQIIMADESLFESDLPAHIRMALQDGWFYSLMGVLIQLFYKTPIGNELVAGFWALTETGTVIATFFLIKRLTAGYYSKGMTLLFAFLSNLIMPFHFSLAGKQRYIGYQSPSVWHNSTYSLMKLVGIIAFAYFLVLKDKYKEGLKLTEWITFAGMLILCNAAKPSFCFMFDIAMLVLLIRDLIKKDEMPISERLKHIVVFGSTVIPSLLVILWQNSVLFGDETGNGITIKPGYALSMRGDHPKVTFVLSIAFPLFVLVWNYADLKWDKRYRFIWLMWLVGFLEVFLLTEEGNRALDSNFFWGYSMAIFFVNVISMIKMIEKMKSTEGIYESNVVRTAITSTGCFVLAYQVYCGIYFFIRLLCGTSYWM